MFKRIVIGLSATGIALAAVVAYAFFKPPLPASEPIQAIPLAVATAQPTANPTVTPAAPNETATGLSLFEIVPAESEARFIIQEVLRGADTTVVGRTNQVAGQLAVNPADLSIAQVGIVQVNARTLTTDNNLRNRAIANQILRTNTHEFVTFTPTAVLGLTGRGEVGQDYTFQIAGDLTITGVTRSVTFDVTVRALSATRLEGTASTTILYRDFQLAIPSSPSVDAVADEVLLQLEFVAVAVS